MMYLPLKRVAIERPGQRWQCRVSGSVTYALEDRSSWCTAVRADGVSGRKEKTLEILA